MQQIILLRCGIAYSSCMSLGPLPGRFLPNLAALRGGLFLGLERLGRLLGGRLPAGERHPRAANQAGNKAAKAVLAMAEPRGLCHPAFVEIERAVYFDLKRMHPRFGLSIEIC